jgi:hypothetical protein
MEACMQIDGIVHRDLYRYGLQFDVQWSQPYWTLTLGMFGIGWFNIIVALIIQFYLLATGRKETRIASSQREVLKSEMPLPPKPVREEIVEIKETEKKKLKSKHKKKIGASKHQGKRTMSTKAKTRPRRKKRAQKEKKL